MLITNQGIGDSSAGACSAAAFAKTDMKAAIHAVFFGGALGDAIGLSTEFMDRTGAQAAARIVTRSESGLRGWPRDAHRGNFAEGDWTDDTDQALLVCRAYGSPAGGASRTKLDAAFAAELVRWEARGFPELGDSAPCGVGMTVGRVACHPLISRAPHLAGLAVWAYSILELGSRGQANGSLMRTAPVGMAHALKGSKAGADAAARDAAVLSRVTHPDPACVACCVAASVTMQQLLAARAEAAAADAAVAACVLPAAAIRAAIDAGRAAASTAAHDAAAWAAERLRGPLQASLGCAATDASLAEGHRRQAAHERRLLDDAFAAAASAVVAAAGGSKDGAQAAGAAGCAGAGARPVGGAGEAALPEALAAALGPVGIEAVERQVNARLRMAAEPGDAAAAIAAATAAAEAGGSDVTALAAVSEVAADAAAVGAIPASETALLRAFGPLDGGSMGWAMHCLHVTFWALRQAALAVETETGLSAAEAASAGGGAGKPEGGSGRTAASVYRDVMLTIAGEGGDADTNAVVAGAMVAAALGPAALPADWMADLGQRVAAPAARRGAEGGAAKAVDGRAWLEREMAAFLAAVGAGVGPKWLGRGNSEPEWSRGASAVSV